MWFKDVNFLADTVTGKSEATLKRVEDLQRVLESVNPEETAENLKRNGGFIPGIRPGKNTQVYLDYVLTRITVIGAAYITVVCVVPEFFMEQTGLRLVVAGGTSLLIVVNVTVDTITQIQSHLLAHQYGDLIKKAKLKGRMR